MVGEDAPAVELDSVLLAKTLRHMALIEEKTGQRPHRVGIVSNEFHMFRAGLMAKEMDLEMVGIPAKTSWVSLRINYFVREIVGVWKHFILGG